MNSTQQQQGASWPDYLKSWLLYPLPQHAISRLTYQLTRIQTAWFKNAFIHRFAQHFQVNWSEALYQRPEDYRHFNDFFTRPLRDKARPIEGDWNTVISPADGHISQVGTIDRDAIFQAKGHEFSVTDLLGGDTQRAELFRDGSFVTVYLSPRDYHRVHMPLSGKLHQTVYIPGRLLSVAPHATRTIPRLFARNERLVSIFDTDAGAMAVVLVGAINVAAIETVWSGLVTPPPRPGIEAEDHQQSVIELERGAEMGRFNMGSTVILLFGKDRIRWLQGLHAGQALQMGQQLGKKL